MSESMETAALEPLVEALETMAFISPIAAPADATPPVDARLVEMEFASPQYGALRLVAGTGFGALLAANLLGVDPLSPEAVAGADDALRELMNITCGQVIRRFGVTADQRLHMSLPTVQPFDAKEQWTRYVNMPGVHTLDADGHIIAFHLVGIE